MLCIDPAELHTFKLTFQFYVCNAATGVSNLQFLGTKIENNTEKHATVLLTEAYDT